MSYLGSSLRRTTDPNDRMRKTSTTNYIRFFLLLHGIVRNFKTKGLKRSCCECLNKFWGLHILSSRPIADMKSIYVAVRTYHVPVYELILHYGLKFLLHPSYFLCRSIASAKSSCACTSATGTLEEESSSLSLSMSSSLLLLPLLSDPSSCEPSSERPPSKTG